MTPYSFSNVQVVVLAAGRGTRMCSAKPKVLHELLGKSMLEHVLTSLESLNARGMSVVTGHDSERVRTAVAEKHHATWVLQADQLGTGHAVQQCETSCHLADHVLIVCGDTPLLQTETLAALISEHEAEDSDVTLLSAIQLNPTGYGRVCRNDHGVVHSVVEEKDADECIRHIQEVSSGIFCVKKGVLFECLAEVDNQNNQAEYYLPSILPIAVGKGYKLHTVKMNDANEMLGVNDRTQLRRVTALLQQRIIRDWEKKGVSFEQVETIRIDTSVHLGMDTVIYAGSQLLGNTHVGDSCEVGPYAVIDCSWVEDGVKIDAFSHLEQSHVSMHARVGPYARLRPQARLDEGVKIGNFVEIKKSVIGQNSKVNHLSYVGDAEVGRECNIGAGTITCNYDGANKHKTLIGDHVFIGSDTKLIAPVVVGDGATLGAGSIITKAVEGGGLTLSIRTEQRYIKEWKRPTKA